MPARHLRDERLEEVGHRELAALPGDLRVEDDLEEEVTQLLAEVTRVAGVEGVQDFVGLLDQERAEGLAGLLPVPGAAAVATQARHHRQQLDETLAGVRARHRGPSADSQHAIPAGRGQYSMAVLPTRAACPVWPGVLASPYFRGLGPEPRPSSPDV